jgi:Secretion system C-terminal sorting domain
MKTTCNTTKKVLVSFVFLSIVVLAKAQVWAPATGTYWYKTFATDPMSCSQGYCKFDYYKDSLIGSNNCQAIRRYRYNQCWNGLFSNYDKYYYTYTSNQITYVNDYLSTGSVQTQTFDTLFYMNAPIGYKWLVSPNSFTNCSGPKSIVTVLDSGHKVIQNVNLKWQKVSISRFCGNAANTLSVIDTIYERFGYLQTDIFEPYNFCSNITDLGSSTPFRCYGDNQIISFKYKGLASNCDYVLSVNDEKYKKSKITLYPNPTSSLISISTDGSIKNIQLYNALGQLVDYKKINSTTIDVSGLQVGIYYINISTNENSFTHKIIKQ